MVLKMKKGILVTTTMLVTIIFVIIGAVIILLLYGSFAAEAGKPTSTIFFKILDFFVGFLS